MYQSPASNLESRFKAMSIERDNVIDSRYSRSSAQASASPTWRRQGSSVPYSSYERGPLYPSSRLAAAQPTDWRSRSSRDRTGVSSTPVYGAPSTVWDLRPPQDAYSGSSRRDVDASGHHRRKKHHRSSVSSSSSEEGSDSIESGAGESSSDSRDARRERHRQRSSMSRKKQSRTSSARRHRDPTRSKYASGRGDDASEDIDSVDLSASPHVVRYVGANNMPDVACDNPPMTRPWTDRPTPSQHQSRGGAVDGQAPMSPRGQSTLMKLMEQQEHNRNRAHTRDSAVVNDSPWNVAAASPPEIPSAASRPSQLLEAIVHNIAFYRRCAPPAVIPPEVSLAFDEYLARGTSLLKFTKRGPPHHRFFSVRFLDLSHTHRVFERTSRTYGDRVEEQSRVSRGLPEAVFCYYSSSNSKVIRRYFPLADLAQVIGNGDGHPFVQRLMTRNGVLKVGRSGPFSKYARADYILQFKFRSHVSMNEETIAVQAPDPTIYLAWQVVADFFSRIGDVPVMN